MKTPKEYAPGAIKKLLIDFDILMYEAAHKADGKFYNYPEVDFSTPFRDEMDRFCKFNKLDPALVEINFAPRDPQVAYDCLEHRVKTIKEDFQDDIEYEGFLTGRGNFRYKIATIQRYKGNRLALRKPEFLQETRQYILDNFKVSETTGEEADDALSYSQTDTTCLCTTDKDLGQIAGWHYKWTTPWSKESMLWQVDELTGLRYFYQQLITGDPGDNILGLYGIGASSKYCKRLQELEKESDMFDLVYALYKQRFGQYAEPFLLETGRLLWIRREREEMWRFPSE